MKDGDNKEIEVRIYNCYMKKRIKRDAQNKILYFKTQIVLIIHIF